MSAELEAQAAVAVEAGAAAVPEAAPSAESEAVAAAAAVPHSRRALLLGAIGGFVAAAAGFARPLGVRAGVDGDVVLDDTNTGSGTTEINAVSSNPAFRAIGGGAGIHGTAQQDASSVGVRGLTAAGQGVRGVATTGIGVAGVSEDGVGVQATSTTGAALFAGNSATTVAAIVAEGGPGTAIHGHANTGGAIPDSPPLTGIYGSALLAGTAIAAASESGLAMKGTSSLGHGIRGRGALDGTIGESTGGRSGVVGYSGSGGAAPAGPAKTGVYGEATQDAASRGVSGFSLAGSGVRGEATSGFGLNGIGTTGQGVRGTATAGVGVYGETTGDAASRGVFGKTAAGQAVRGESTTGGIGVRAVSATGNALDVSGKVKLNRSGIAQVPANADFVDVTVPGGIASTSMVFATVQIKRNGAFVLAARPNWPTAGLLRIYLNTVASTTVATPVAWFVLL